MSTPGLHAEDVGIPIEHGHGELRGDLATPRGARGLVVFAHGSGSSRLSPRNRAVARTLNDAGLATLLVDLLTGREEIEDARTARLRFDIPLLTKRLLAACAWAHEQDKLARLAIGLFGASTGAAAALAAAARDPELISAVVSRGGRPDLAGPWLEQVQAPTLLVVGSRDTEVLELNQQAARRLRCKHRVAVVPGATHPFEEAGTLERAAELATFWLVEHLTPRPVSTPTPRTLGGMRQSVRRPAPQARHDGRYADRAEAGAILAQAVAAQSESLVEPLVLALPRGGIPVAVPIARELGAPIEVVVTRKIGTPEQPELALGAVDEDGNVVIDDRLLRALSLPRQELRVLIERASAEVVDRVQLLRDDRPLPALAGHDVVLVDDGYATGMTALSAARYLRRHGAHRVMLAVPVAPPSLVEQPPTEFDEVICPYTPDPFRAVGFHYQHFDQVTDAEVAELLDAGRSDLRSRRRP